MASVLHKQTKQFISRANTPDYMDGNWLINPDMSVVEGLPSKYWIIEGETLRAATTEERDSIDIIDGYVGLPLDEVKAIINRRINDFRDNYINNGVVFLGHQFDSDQRARENITGICSAISLGITIPGDYTWRSRINEDVPMNAAAIVQFGLGTMNFVSNCFGVSWYHKDTIKEMDTEDLVDILNYDYTVGWPTRSLDGSSLS